MGDLWALYGLSVDDLGRSPAMTRVFLSLLERIGYEPWSVFRAEQLGGMHWLGWSVSNDALASVVEELRANTLTVAKVGGGKRVPSRPEQYQGRPQVQAQRPKTLSAAFGQLAAMRDN